MSLDIGFGCVQIGMPYGVRQNEELMSEAEAHELLELAFENGIVFFDTAPVYGLSEQRIGRSQLPGRTETKIATKIPTAPSEIWQDKSTYLKFVTDSVSKSLEQLRTQRIFLLQFHQCDLAFLASASFREACRFLKNSSWMENLGVSVYSVKQAETAMEAADLQYLQVPVNLIDLRFANPSFSEIVRRREVSLVARSVFLQGVLVDGKKPPSVKRAAELAVLQEKLQSIAKNANSSVYELAVAYVFNELPDTFRTALIGFDSPRSILDILKFRRTSQPFSPKIRSELDSVRDFVESTRLYDPTTWNTIQ